MMANESLETWIVLRLSEALNIPAKNIDPVAPFTRLGVDSMVLIGFVAELEQHLGRPLDTQLLFEHPSPRALAHHLCQGD